MLDDGISVSIDFFDDCERASVSTIPTSRHAPCLLIGAVDVITPYFRMSWKQNGVVNVNGIVSFDYIHKQIKIILCRTYFVSQAVQERARRAARAQGRLRRTPRGASLLKQHKQILYMHIYLPKSYQQKA